MREISVTIFFFVFPHVNMNCFRFICLYSEEYNDLIIFLCSVLGGGNHVRKEWVYCFSSRVFSYKSNEQNIYCACNLLVTLSKSCNYVSSGLIFMETKH